jgi:hypothetical protein
MTLSLDASCQALADYLKDYLNEAIREIQPNTIAVRYAICYNNLPVDLSSFPLLKVYRTQDKFSINKNKSDVVAGYCLSFPEEEKIPGILRWCAVNIDKALREWGINKPGCNPDIDPQQEISAEYRVMSLQGEAVFALLQLNFSIEETSDGC